MNYFNYRSGGFRPVPRCPRRTRLSVSFTLLGYPVAALISCHPQWSCEKKTHPQEKCWSPKVGIRHPNRRQFILYRWVYLQSGHLKYFAKCFVFFPRWEFLLLKRPHSTWAEIPAGHHLGLTWVQLDDQMSSKETSSRWIWGWSIRNLVWWLWGGRLVTSLDPCYYLRKPFNLV